MRMSISKLLDVEEKIWSPKYGLKGVIDATVQITLQNETDEKLLTVPLEVKTGKKPTAAHRAQTALYTVLCSDRYGQSPAHPLPEGDSAYDSIQILMLLAASSTIWRLRRRLA